MFCVKSQSLLVLVAYYVLMLYYVNVIVIYDAK